MENFDVFIANDSHLEYSEGVSQLIDEAAKVKDSGLAKRSPEYIAEKIREGKAVIALFENRVVGFCYIESWGEKKFVANSGLIVSPEFRGQGLAKLVKEKAFELSREKFPHAKLFGLTTSLAVMKINSSLGYTPVTFTELTDDDDFWKGCETCNNYDILQRTKRTNCLCTAMVCDPDHKKEKVVLAFSGGLDTSYCAKYLSKEKDLSVYTAIVNTGGFSAEELHEIEQKALRLGVRSHVCLNETDRYYQKCIRYLVYGNILKNNTYPLSVSSERIFQAIAIAEYAKSIGAKYIAHGSTGAGNDQVRFDLAFHILCPEMEIITPIRDLKLSREQEIEYLKQNGVEHDWKKATYSINQGFWGTSIGGKETLTSNQTIPEHAYPSQLKAKDETILKLHFKKGEFIGIDDKISNSPVYSIYELNRIASRYAIGRDMHVGDTIIGIKGRVAFEAAAPLLIIKSHHALEKHTLTKWQLYWKEQLANWYGMLLHEAQYFEPVMRNIEKFLEDTQLTVTGKVIVRLFPYNFQVIGIESENDMMNAKFASYGEENRSFSGEDVKGFTKIFANQMNIFYSVNNELLK